MTHYPFQPRTRRITPKPDETAVLVDNIAEIAAAKGFTFSRWEAHAKRGFGIWITYALHYGERTRSAPREIGGAIIAITVLTQPEGKTPKSTAYRMLKELEMIAWNITQ